MANSSGGIVVLVLGLAGIGAWLYTRQQKPVNNPAAITAPPPIPKYSQPVQQPARTAAAGIVGGLTGLFGSLVSGSSNSGTTWASMPTGVNRQGQATPLLNNNAFVSRM